MIFRNLEPQTFVPNFRHLPLQGRCCSMTSWFHLVDFQRLGKGLRTDNDGKTISSLRLDNAICVNNIDFGSTTKRLKPRSRVEVSFWTSQRKFGNPSRSWHEWPAGADVEVPRCQMQILKQYPRYAWLRFSVMKALIMIIIILSKGWLLLRGTPRIRNRQPKPPMNHLLRYWGNPPWLSGFCPIFILDVFLRSWVAWVAAHWRSEGHQRVGYPHSCT